MALSWSQYPLLPYKKYFVRLNMQDNRSSKTRPISITENQTPAIPVLKAFIYFVMVFLGVLAILPVYLVFINITRSTPEINSGLTLLPSVHLLDNWRILNSTGFSLSRGFFNSFLIASLTSLCATYSSAMAAYGIHVYQFRFKRALWGMIMFVMLFPLSLSYIGFFRIVFSLRLLDSYIPLIVPVIASPVVVFFLRQYLVSLPVRELAEVSRIDGAGEFWTFNAIILPVMGPALATQTFFIFVASWNNFVLPYMLLSDRKLFTLPMMAVLLQADIHNVEFGGIYLGIALSFIPAICVYIVASRFIISGITAGSFKE